MAEARRANRPGRWRDAGVGLACVAVLAVLAAVGCGGGVLRPHSPFEQGRWAESTPEQVRAASAAATAPDDIGAFEERLRALLAARMLGGAEAVRTDTAQEALIELDALRPDAERVVPLGLGLLERDPSREVRYYALRLVRHHTANAAVAQKVRELRSNDDPLLSAEARLIEEAALRR